MKTARPLLLLLLPCLALGWWDFWPYTEHQDLTDKSVDIAIERWPGMADELERYRGELRQGSHDEDFGQDTLYGSSADYSAYSIHLPGAWWPTARLPLNALQWVRAPENPFSWDRALAQYPSDPAAAWLAVGHVLHNLQDLFVPAHAFVAPHGPGTGGLVRNHSWPLYFDNFEQWCEVSANELGRARPERVPTGLAAVESLLVRAARFAATDQDSLDYYPSLFHAPPDSVGGWGRYRPYPSGSYPCGEDRIDNNLANAWSLFIVPACVEHGAGLIRHFHELNQVGTREQPASLPPAAGCAVIPNPSRGPVRIVGLPADRPLEVFDTSGRTVRRLGTAMRWDGCDNSGRPVPPGVYLVCRDRVPVARVLRLARSLP